MKRIQLTAAAICALATVSGAVFLPAGEVAAAPAAGTTDNGVMLMSVGASRVVNLSGRMSDVIVANPNIADVVVRSQTQIYILAKAAGETAVTVTSANGKALYSTIVRVGNNLTSIDQMLKLAMPEAEITVSKMNGLYLLTGTVKAPEDAAEAERLVQAFASGPGTPVTVVSRLRTATPLQVNLQVKFAEVSRSLVHQIGMNWSTFDRSGGSFGGYVGRTTRNFGSFDMDPTSNTYGSFTFNQPADGSTTLGFIAKMFGMDVAGALDLAENSGLATTLAQPNLTSLSGETASFLAGGEYPYTISNGTQGNSIQFKQYGVQLAFTPTVLADGRISLRVRPTVSSLDFSISASVPALKSRSAETTVELGSGQAFMIAGLLNNGTSNAVDKVPGLGDLPILGSLFKSRRYQRDETELVIVVTPYLVRPINASEVHLPTDGFRSATPMQGLLLQQGADGVSGAKPQMPSVAPSVPPADPATGQAITPQASVQEPRRNRKTRRAETAKAEVGPGFTF